MEVAVVPNELPAEAEAELRAALTRLSRGPGLPARLAELVGGALGGLGRMVAGRLAGFVLPGVAPFVQAQLSGVAEAALARAFDAAVVGLGSDAKARTGAGRARLLVAASGAAGGAAGLAGFAPDAMVTTLAIMRRIARVAREEGEDLTEEAGRRACLEVFGLRSGAGGTDDGGYFPTRLLLQGGPLVRLLADVAARYGLQLGQKLAAQAVPVAGAVCGAAINVAFMAEYDGLARAHFTVRRLERVHGVVAVQNAAIKFRD